MEPLEHIKVGTKVEADTINEIVDFANKLGNLTVGPGLELRTGAGARCLTLTTQRVGGKAGYAWDWADVFVLDWNGNILWTAYIAWDDAGFQGLGGRYGSRRAITADADGNVYVLCTAAFDWPNESADWAIARIDKPKVFKRYYTESDPDRPRVRWVYHSTSPDVDISSAVDIAVGRDDSDDPGLFVVDNGFTVIAYANIARKLGLLAHENLWTGFVFGSTVPLYKRDFLCCDVTGDGRLHIGRRTGWDLPTVKNYFIWDVAGNPLISYRVSNYYKDDPLQPEITWGLCSLETADKHSGGGSNIVAGLQQALLPPMPEPVPLGDYVIFPPSSDGWNYKNTEGYKAGLSRVAAVGARQYWAGYNWHDVSDPKYVHWLYAITGNTCQWHTPQDSIAELADQTIVGMAVECTHDTVALASTARWTYLGTDEVIPECTFIRGYTTDYGNELWRTKLHYGAISPEFWDKPFGIIDTDHRNGLIYAFANASLKGRGSP